MIIKTTLCGISYDVIEQDGQVIFQECTALLGQGRQFTLEWMGCGWYLVDFEDILGCVPVPHIIAAFQWVEANYTKNWIDGTATVKMKEL